MQGMRTSKYFRITLVALLVLCLALVGCGESSSTSSSSGNAAVANPTRTTLLDERSYDINNVDPEVYEAGEEFVRLSLTMMNCALEKADEGAELEEIMEALNESSVAANEAQARFRSVVGSQSNLDFDTQMYVIEVRAFESSMSSMGEALGNRINGTAPSNGTHLANVSTNWRAGTFLNERTYNLDMVDSRVYEAGEEYLRCCLDMIIAAESTIDAGGTPEEYVEALEEYVDRRDEALSELADLYNSQSNWDYDTQMYCVEVNAFATSMPSIGEALDAMVSANYPDMGNGSSGTTEEPEPTPSQTDNGEVDPAVREFGEAYEAFVDEYVAFMKRYNDASPDEQSAMMYDYLDLMQRYADMIEKLGEFEEASDSWNAATLAYWTELTIRCAEKLLEAY